MSKTLYLECSSGISGDMMTAALIDLGADVNTLREALSSLPVDGFQIQISRVKKAGLDVCDFTVILDAEYENHDHDMNYLHGKHCAEEKKVHEHIYRTYADICEILEKSTLRVRAKETAKKIFSILADAEAKAHGVSKEAVHFHEVGAVDSIVDIVAAAVCLDNLDITEVIIKELCEGCGTIRCQHGILPVPVPAVVNIVQENHLKLKITEVQGELVTPTGAAIAAAIRTSDVLPENFLIEKIGMGAGKRTYDCAGILRAMILLEEKTPNWAEKDEICKIETNIDDCSGENLGFLMERLMENGAKDVSYHPIYMKKNRPAYQIEILCAKEDVKKIEILLFQETTTIGIRKSYMERTVLKRTKKTVDTSFGEVQVKVCKLPEGERIYPEYEEVVRISRACGLSYFEVYERIILDTLYTERYNKVKRS